MTALPVAGVTVTFTAADVAGAPRLSVATAVREYVPAGALLHEKPSGAVVASPSLVPPWKNSTLATLPSTSVAVAEIGMFAGAVNVAPLAGLVMLTAGGLFDRPGLTVMLTAADVVVAPRLSVALAVRE